MAERDIVALRVLEELKELLNEQDYSLLTRLLLDFLTDNTFESDLLRTALEIRKSYNLGLLDPQSLHNKLFVLLESLSVASLNLPNIQVQHLYQKGIDAIESKSKEAATLVCRCEKLEKHYPRSGFKLGPIDLRLVAGEMTGVVGENGNGKTTLLRLIGGDILHTSGSIDFPELKGKTWYEFKTQIAYIEQEIEHWHGSVKNNLHFSAANHGLFGKENELRVQYIIHRLGLSQYEDAWWHQISTGYRLRFQLAKALVWRPKLLILDEPLANLDINTKLLVLQDLKLLAASEKYPMSIILSSQQLHEIEKVVDNLIFIKQGEVIFNDRVALLGTERKTNTIEVSGGFSREQLYLYLKGIEIISLTDSGNSFLINIPLQTEPKAVLQQLLQHTEIDYFRDISKSSRKFF